MSNCPYNKNVKCNYIERESEWRRQLDIAEKEHIQLRIFENTDCPVNAQMCRRLVVANVQKQR